MRTTREPRGTRWFVRERGGAEQGPFLVREVDRKVEAGDISGRAEVRPMGNEEWQPVSTFLKRARERSRLELEDARWEARRRSRSLMISGGAMLVAGVLLFVASVASLFLMGVGVTGGLVLIVGGFTQLARGWHARP